MTEVQVQEQVEVSGVTLVNQQMAAEAAALQAQGYGTKTTPAAIVSNMYGSTVIGYVTITSIPTSNPDNYTVGYRIQFTAPVTVTQTKTVEVQQATSNPPLTFSRTAATSPETTTAAPTNEEPTAAAPTSTPVSVPFVSRWFAAFMKFLSFGDTKL